MICKSTLKKHLTINLKGNINMLNPDKVKLAIAPIGWTNDDMPDLGAENTFE